ncbi:putative S-(hydroxymethyl)glutathione dehydrogenase 1 [Neolecta irregularis DAH-3]|uniref:Putative S-(Hydroxymethyl)glutathione dehydrogenase 1 n=1 Tax=Neolecta irregularis (strain DAH-3) TaxID=1198029 RepID=A0A1U7LN83_NEOID|nr:putative S-(hydroxymethyl)glutathione dehydrogenase 1 [Neolecta irregularis DAH-3]|eukprot:OLL24115.1 putative S-(hydroxymethyl)glutathione dehydrogenase 1 [Neolecta irregularis DAH-3]
MSSTIGKTITCKAAIAWAPSEPLSIEEVEVAPPKAHEVRIKILYTGCCHTDAYTISGKDPEGNFPVICGHEGGGIVESIGESVTTVKVGDHVIPLYTAECQKCKFCISGRTNLCSSVRTTQGMGLMPDGTTRFRARGKDILHYMGTSTFSQYTVVADVSLVAIDKSVSLDKACLLGCGITTGYGAAVKTVKVENGSVCAIFGAGCVGLSVIQGCVLNGAKTIIAIDTNDTKRSWADMFGATHFVNPIDIGNKSIDEYLVDSFDGGVDYAFDCTGNVGVMEQALIWGKLCVIGVAAAGQKLSFKPFLVVTGRQVVGTAFGGIKGRSELPDLVQLWQNGQLKVSEYITHERKLAQINEAFEAMESGNCIRTVIDMRTA